MKVVGVVCSLILLAHAPRAGACGSTIEPLWTTSRMPGPEFGPYARGELGLVRETLDNSILLVAYRHLSGHPLTEEQAFQMTRIWRDLNSSNKEDDPGHRDGLAWSKLVADLFGITRPVGPLSDGVEAMRQATQVLRDRTRRSRKWARLWAYRQCRTFATGEMIDAEQGQEPRPELAADACALLPEQDETIPADAPRWLKDDAAYQEAVRLFRLRRLEDAEKAFRQIAGEQTSVWHEFARYMELRTKRNRLEDAGAESCVNLEPVADGLRELLKTARTEEARGAALADLARIESQTARDRWPAEAVKYLLTDNSGLPRLLVLTWWSSEHTSDPVDWLSTMQEDGIWSDDEPGRRLRAGELKHALSRWREKRSLPWLIAALSKAEHRRDLPEDLWTAAIEVPETSPGWLTVDYQAARLLIAAGEGAAAREHLDAALSRKDLDGSTRVFFQRLRGRAPKSAEMAFRDSIRRSFVRADLANTQWDWEPTILAWDDEARASMAQSLTAAQLLGRARSPDCPKEMRDDVTKTAWARAVVVGDWKTASEAATDLQSLNLVLQGPLARWSRATTPDEQRLEALIIMSRFGRISPIGFVGLGIEKWWCGLSELTPVIPADDTPEEAKTLQRELQTLRSLSLAPNYFVQSFIELSATFPTDERVAEGLHHAVDVTHYGCVDRATSRFSRRAFDWIHRRFPKSRWARETPYWY